jgi:hypothetical protein
MNQNPKILYEIIRLLMVQVEEEKHSRQAMIRAMMVGEVMPIQIPTDEEVNARITELYNLVPEVKRS